MTKKINHAISSYNGITIYSNLFPKCGVQTYYDENGKIYSKVIKGYPDDVLFDAISETKRIPALVLSVNIILWVIIFFLLNTQNSNIALYITFLFFLCTDVSTDYITIFMRIIQKWIKKSKKGDIARFHAAEHMSTDAYEKLQRIPTLQEIKKFSRFSKTCGSMKLFNSIFSKTLLCLMVYFISNRTINLYVTMGNQNLDMFTIIIAIEQILLVLLFYYGIKKCVKEYSLMRFMQFTVTQKPTDKELKLAIEALKNYEKVEKKIKDMIVFSSTE